jgi:hypothetical protein
MFGSFLPLYPQPFPFLSLRLLSPHSLPGRNCSALISNFVEERVINNNKKGRAFLLVETRIAIQGDS